MLLLIPAAHGQAGAVVWAAPTHPDQFRFTATTGKPFAFTLTASTSNAKATLEIEPVNGLPAGASISTSIEGNAAEATFRWRPLEIGEYRIGFVARSAGAPPPRSGPT